MPFSTIDRRLVAPFAALASTFYWTVSSGADDAAGPEVVVVTSSLIETPLRQVGAAVSVIDGADIELRGYTSLADVLRTQPGITVSNSGGLGKNTVLRVRGEEHYRTLLMLDGVKALDPSAPQVAPSFDNLLSTSDLERVEILRGPQGFIYGADAGGVVNALTIRGAGPMGGRLGAEYGAFDTARYNGSLSGGNEHGDYFVSLTDFSTDGFNAQSIDSVLADDDGTENTTLHAKLGWNAADALRFQLVARDIDASAAYDNCSRPITFETTHDCNVTTTQRTYKVSADYRPGAFTHTAGYSSVDIERDNFVEGASAFASTGTISRLEYTGSYRSADALTLVYGVDLQSEELIGEELLERDQDAYYAEYQGRFADALFVSLGTRRDRNDAFGTHTSTRLSSAYVHDLDAGRSLKYRVSVGTGFRAPSLFEIAYNDGPFASPPAADLALTEESSRGYDVGVEYDNDSGLHLEATYFDQTIEDELYFDLDNFSGYLQSPGTSTSEGIELAMSAPLGERWELLANWTRNDTADTADEQRLRRPEHVGNLGFLFATSDDKLRVMGNYRVTKNAVDIGLVPLDDYEILDVSLAYALSQAFELHARAENLTDEGYEEVRGFNAAGRSVYAGVRFRLR
jgi:vitamin B12 transporter